MALFRGSALVQSISGALGGAVFVQGAAGHYVKARGVKCTPTVLSDRYARAGFSLAVQAWKGLSDAQRKAWGILGARTYRTDRLGVQKTYSGRALFMSQALTTGRVHLPPVLDAPGLGTRQFFASFSASFTSVALTCSYVAQPFSGTGWVITYGVRAFSKGGFSRKQYIVLDARTFGASGTYDITSNFEIHMGKPILDEFYGLRVSTRYPGSLWSLPYEVIHRRV